MKKGFFKKFVGLGLAATLTLSLAACGSSDKKGTSAGNKTDTVPTFDNIQLGKDYKNIKADIKFLTHKTDVVDTTFKEYIKEFQKLYPNINIKYEGVTNYADDIVTRLTTDDWGDICMIPANIDKDELPNKFVCYGDNKKLSEKYIMLNDYSYDGKVYGIPSNGNAQGIVYNKKIFKQAGITTLPKTPDEFLADLKLIKQKTKAIPLYSNFAAKWTMTAWDAYIGGSATGDPDYMNNIVHMKDPFSKQSDMTGPYAVYYTLYESAKRNLIEDDPTTTDWEGSKGMMNEGKIGCMVLGTWAVTQIQQAGKNAKDIAYMPFPITVKGKQYAAAGPDYNYGINKNASKENQIASMLYVKWLTEKSNFAYDQGCIPIVKGAEYPKSLKDFNGIELVINNPAPKGEETYFNDVNNDSELGINTGNDEDSNILQAAVDGKKSLDEIMAEWNKKWAQGQKANDIEVNK
ncbi:multiple sugar ABC transporter, substrate-binding protein [Lachnospiraceae bacterium KM106-2]|nr:multiple sugar ABC transporter, substrate-binding protein [Lachnospiraceae bacterium KM106-2]